MSVLKILTFFLFISSYVFGQSTDTTTVKRRKSLLGFHGGITNTTLSGTEVDLSLRAPNSYQESQTGIEVAMDYKFEASRFFYIKTGAGISTKNSYMIGSSQVYPLRAELKFFSIPFLIGLQTQSDLPLIFGFEGGIMANLDAGSTMNNTAGLHPDNTVVMENFVPALVGGVNLEIKPSDHVRIFVNYRVVNDLDDYYKRTYRVYDGLPGGNYTEYHYNFRISSTYLTAGLLFSLK